MTVHKIIPPGQNAGQEGGSASYSLANYKRRHFLESLGDRRTPENNWCYKIGQQRHLVTLLLLGVACYCVYLSYESILFDQTLKACGLLALAVFHLSVVWWQLKAELDWLVLLLSSSTLLSLFAYLLIKGGSLEGDVLWALTMAPAFFFLLGHFWGLLSFSLSVALTIVVFFNPSTIEFLFHPSLLEIDFVAKERFLGVFLLLGVYSFLLEYDRSRVVGSLLTSRDKLKVQASTDELTGLANRHHMRECLSQQERRCAERKEHYGLILADIDHFKHINDQHGHDCGDQVITAVANALRSALRDEDVVARWGGEEFLVVLPDSDADNAKLVAGKLREAVAKLDIDYDDQHIYPTLSFGVVNGDQYQNVQSLIRQADRCLYQAKHKGRDCIVYS